MRKCSDLGNCVAKGTRILMADGSEMRIEDIRMGDQIATASSVAMVSDIWRGTEKNMISIETEQGSKLIVTSNHYIHTDRAVIKAKDVTVGTSLVMENNTKNMVKSLGKAQKEDEYASIEVYNLGVEMRDNSKGTMICEGIVVMAGF